jgi:anaerobic selenocysteine-containing dehydrogenase
MSGNDINRRDFLKFLGLGGVGAATLSGCDMPTTVTLEEGKEKVVAYLAPEEYAIPGIANYFASTCQQCPAGCGVHGRVREGRVLKLEGNPMARNGRGLCQMGQASIQTHYNPDRITQPMARKGGSLTPVSWDEAWKMMGEKVSGVGAGRSAWVTGTISGHQAKLLDTLGKAWGGKDHYVYENVNNAVGEAVNEAVLGDPMPAYRLDKAKSVLSFGADFLGTWLSPTHFCSEYAKFRSGDRGVLIQVEPKMTLTGGNADLWVPARPGTEGVMAMGIANVLLTKNQVKGDALPKAALDEIAKYNVDKVTQITGVSGDSLVRIANYLKERSPSLVLAGESAQGHVNGYQNTMAAMMLNVLLGNVGKTIQPSNSMAFSDLKARTGSSRALTDFAKAAGAGKYDVVFFQGTNPVYSAPAHVGMADKLAKVPFKVALSMFQDETTMMADLVLPLVSPYEDWGTTVAPYQPIEADISVTQPLMKKLYPDTMGMGDILLSMLKFHKVEGYADYADYYAYLRSQLSKMPASVKGGKSDADFWSLALQHGLIKAPTSKGSSLKAKLGNLRQAAYEPSNEYPLHLVPSTNQNMYDGRNANIPWLQEAPDQISKVYWDSWAELHPKTAAKLGVKEGEYIRIESDQGAIETQVYIHKGVHVDAVGVAKGRGHEEYGRYAKGNGVNVMKILSAAVEEKSGEMATYATRVRISKTGRSEHMPRLGGSETQVGRRLVSSVSADVFRRTEGGDTDVA